MSDLEDTAPAMDPALDPAFGGDEFATESLDAELGLGSSSSGVQPTDLADELDDALHLQTTPSPQHHTKTKSFDRRTRRRKDSFVSDKNEDGEEGEGLSLGDELGVNGFSAHDGEQQQLYSSTQDPDGSDEEDEAEFEADIERKTQRVAEMERAILESVQTTDSFLRKLHGLAGTTTGSTGISSSTSGAVSLSLSETEPLSSTGPAITEDTARLETAAGAVVRQLQELANQREAQVRELRDIERILARPEPEWQAVLAEVEELPISAQEHIVDPLGFLDSNDGMASSRVPMTRGIGKHRVSTVDEDEVVDEDGIGTNIADEESDDAEHSVGFVDTVSGHDRSRRTRFATGTKSAADEHDNIPSHDAPASQQLAHLHRLTAALVHSLSGMHERAQVHRAAINNDAGRRLRSTRAVLTQIRAEMDGVSRSCAWIAQWEGQSAIPNGQASEEISTVALGDSPNVLQRPDNIRHWTQQQMERFEKILSDAESRAHHLLKPLPMPANSLPLSDPPSAVSATA